MGVLGYWEDMWGSGVVGWGSLGVGWGGGRKGSPSPSLGVSSSGEGTPHTGLVPPQICGDRRRVAPCPPPPYPPPPNSMPPHHYSHWPLPSWGCPGRTPGGSSRCPPPAHSSVLRSSGGKLGGGDFRGGGGGASVVLWPQGAVGQPPTMGTPHLGAPPRPDPIPGGTQPLFGVPSP